MLAYCCISRNLSDFRVFTQFHGIITKYNVTLLQKVIFAIFLCVFLCSLAKFTKIKNLAKFLLTQCILSVQGCQILNDKNQQSLKITFWSILKTFHSKIMPPIENPWTKMMCTKRTSNLLFLLLSCIVWIYININSQGQYLPNVVD